MARPQRPRVRLIMAFSCSFELLRHRREELDHALAQSITDQEICFRIAEFVMAMPGVRRIFGAADEVVRFDEEDVGLELGPACCVGLSFSQRCPGAGSLHPGARQFADDDRQLWGLQVLADIVDAAAMADSQIWPSWVSPSPIMTKNREGRASSRDPSAIPKPSDSPCPSEPVEAPRLGMKRISGWPWNTLPNCRSVFSLSLGASA